MPGRPAGKTDKARAYFAPQATAGVRNLDQLTVKSESTSPRSFWGMIAITSLVADTAVGRWTN